MGRKGLEEGEKDLVEKPGKTFEFNLDLPEDFVAENNLPMLFYLFLFLNNQSVLVQSAANIGLFIFYGDFFKDDSEQIPLWRVQISLQLLVLFNDLSTYKPLNKNTGSNVKSYESCMLVAMLVYEIIRIII